MRPNFLCAGAAKSGTTWLYRCLRQHPHVYLPITKELHFFSYDENFVKGNDWYQQFFEGADAKHAVGEFSPSYLASEKAAERIYAYEPKMRLVFLLRNPIERAYSHYCMAAATGRLSADVNKMLTIDTSYVRWGCYWTQVQRFLKFFDRRQLGIFFFEDLKNTPSAFFADVSRFVGVEAIALPDHLNRRINVTKPLPRSPLLARSIDHVMGYVRMNTYAEGALTFARNIGFLDKIVRLNHRDLVPPIADSKFDELASFYEMEVVQLGHFVGKDLSGWLKRSKKENREI